VVDLKFYSVYQQYSEGMDEISIRMETISSSLEADPEAYSLEHIIAFLRLSSERNIEKAYLNGLVWISMTATNIAIFSMLVGVLIGQRSVRPSD
jgi:hypothetical protein